MTLLDLLDAEQQCELVVVPVRVEQQAANAAVAGSCRGDALLQAVIEEIHATPLPGKHRVLSRNGSRPSFSSPRACPCANHAATAVAVVGRGEDASASRSAVSNVASGAPYVASGAPSSEASAAHITGRRSVAAKGVHVQGRTASQHDPLDSNASDPLDSNANELTAIV